MTDGDDEPRAMIVLVVDDGEIALGRVDGASRCDLGLIDDLLRLRLAATRSGCSLRLTHVDQELRELLDLVGLSDCLDADGRRIRRGDDDSGGLGHP